MDLPTPGARAFARTLMLLPTVLTMKAFTNRVNPMMPFYLILFYILMGIISYFVPGTHRKFRLSWKWILAGIGVFTLSGIFFAAVNFPFSFSFFFL